MDGNLWRIGSNKISDDATLRPIDVYSQFFVDYANAGRGDDYVEGSDIRVLGKSCKQALGIDRTACASDTNGE